MSFIINSCQSLERCSLRLIGCVGVTMVVLLKHTSREIGSTTTDDCRHNKSEFIRFYRISFMQTALHLRYNLSVSLSHLSLHQQIKFPKS